jgi:hypothetical protein
MWSIWMVAVILVMVVVLIQLVRCLKYLDQLRPQQVDQLLVDLLGGVLTVCAVGLLQCIERLVELK